MLLLFTSSTKIKCTSPKETLTIFIGKKCKNIIFLDMNILKLFQFLPFVQKNTFLHILYLKVWIGYFSLKIPRQQLGNSVRRQFWRLNVGVSPKPVIPGEFKAEKKLGLKMRFFIKSLLVTNPPR